jgi:hypothetical protein
MSRAFTLAAILDVLALLVVAAVMRGRANENTAANQ